MSVSTHAQPKLIRKTKYNQQRALQGLNTVYHRALLSFCIFQRHLHYFSSIHLTYSISESLEHV